MIPPKDTAQNNSESVLKYRGNLVGDINPSLPDPPAGDYGCSGGQVLMMVVAIAVTIATQGAAAEMLAETLAGTIFPGEVLASSALDLVFAESVAIGAAAGDLAGQVAGNIVGVHHGIDLGEVALSAAGAFIGASIFPTPVTQGDYAGMALRSATSNVVSQGLNVITGRQDSFNWRGVIASAIAAPIASSIAEGANDAMRMAGTDDVLRNIAANATRSIVSQSVFSGVTGGKMKMDQVVADAFGNFIGGSMAGNNIKSASQQSGNLQSSWEDINDAGSDVSDIDDIFNNSERFADSSRMSIGANGRGMVSDSPYANGDSLSKLKLSRDGLGANPDTEIDAIAAEIKARPPLSPAEQRWQATLNQSDDYAEYENDRLLARAPAPVQGQFGSEARAIGAMEGFFTFDRPGQIIKGIGLGLKAPLDMLEGAANLLQDGYGYSAEALTGDPYQAKSGLIRSVQSQGLVATAGDLFVNTVKSLPLIGSINSIYRNDMVGLGQSLPATVGLGAGLRGVGANTAATPASWGLTISETKTVLSSAQASYKGSTVVGHALSKHSGRPATFSNPEVSGADVWGGIKGKMPTWNEQGMSHVKDIIRAPGEFKLVPDGNLTFLEKRLPDGRGVRLKQDMTFKGFVD